MRLGLGQDADGRRPRATIRIDAVVAAQSNGLQAVSLSTR